MIRFTIKPPTIIVSPPLHHPAHIRRRFHPSTLTSKTRSHPTALTSRHAHLQDPLTSNRAHIQTRSHPRPARIQPRSHPMTPTSNDASIIHHSERAPCGHGLSARQNRAQPWCTAFPARYSRQSGAWCEGDAVSRQNSTPKSEKRKKVFRARGFKEAPAPSPPGTAAGTPPLSP